MDLNQVKIIPGENLKLDNMGLCPKPQGLCQFDSKKGNKKNRSIDLINLYLLFCISSLYCFWSLLSVAISLQVTALLYSNT